MCQQIIIVGCEVWDMDEVGEIEIVQQVVILVVGDVDKLCSVVGQNVVMFVEWDFVLC